MKKALLLKPMLLLFALIVGSSCAWAEKKTEGFETKATSQTYNSTVEISEAESDCSIGWTIYYGTVSTNERISGSNSAQMRWYASATSNLPYIKSTTAIDGLTNVSLKARTSDLNVKMDISYSADGSSWTVGQTYTFTETGKGESVSLDIPSGNKYVMFGVSSSSTKPSSGNYKLIVDDVVFTYTVLPAYTITAVSNDTDKGTVSLSGGTITASPKSGCRVSTTEPYTVTDGTATVTNNGDDTFTVSPTSDCTIQINFEEIPTWTVSWSVNGTVVSTSSVKDNQSITFDPPTSGVPTGYSFMGWSDTKILTPQASAPTYVTSAMATADKTYYAVLAAKNGDPYFVKQTSGDVDGEYLIVYEGDNTHSSVAFKGSLEDFDAKENGIGVTITDNKIAWSQTYDDNTFSIDSQTGYIKGKSGKYIGQSSYANGLTSTDEGVANTFSFDNGNAVIGKTFTGGTVTLRYNYASDQSRFRYYKSGQQAIALYKSMISYSDYCTTVIPTGVTVTIASSGYTTLSSAHGLDFANATAENADALIAYIIPSNDGVKLTKTEVTEAPAGTGVLLKGTPGATYTIPVKSGAAEVGPNLLKAGPKVVEEGNTTIYLLKSGKFRLASAGTTSVGKAYLELHEAVGAPALSIDGDDETTGINLTTVNGQQATDGVYYDLSGRRVAQPTKGVFIVNGKKVVIK